MKKVILILLTLTPVCYNAAAQALVKMAPGINLPRDTAIVAALLDNLNRMLQSVEHDSAASFIHSRARVHTQDLFDEMKGIQASGRYKSKSFYKPYLLNVQTLSDSCFLLQLSFMGVADTFPIIRASFDLLAYHSRSGGFLFSSPILEHTKGWKSKRVGNINFHYREQLDLQQAEKYWKYISRYDRKLGNKEKVVEYYACANTTEALHTLGVAYKSDYSGRQTISLTSSGDDQVVTVASGPIASFDPHDLWHARLYQAVPAKLVSHPVDEGCAYLYGGSWGLSWQEIFKMFMMRVASSKDMDWLSLYEKDINFADAKQPELMASFVINALLVEKIEKEKGFAPVMELLKSGPVEKGGDNYFEALNRIAGINRSNYNTEVWKLVREAGGREY